MEKELYIIKMEILNMRVIGLIIKKKVMENGLMDVVIIISVNLKIIWEMEKEKFIYQMELWYMMEYS